jgi:hypothetical protein
MKGLLLAFALLFFYCTSSFAQRADQNTLQNLSVYQDTLKALGKKFINDPDDLERKNANYSFIKLLVGALKQPNSFNYPFDSVKSVSITLMRPITVSGYLAGT